MRHSYVQRPRRLPSARAITRRRSRALPFVLALPLVGVLWVTIGLPILSNLTTASSADRRSRDSSLVASDPGHGKQRSGETTSVATFAAAVLRAVGYYSSSGSSSSGASSGSGSTLAAGGSPGIPPIVPGS